MSLNYTPIVDVDDVGLLAMPFPLSPPVPGIYDRVWVSRESQSRGRFLNRYTGEEVFLTDPPGFGENGFGEGIFGWS
jgi:hypothetical protein